MHHCAGEEVDPSWEGYRAEVLAVQLEDALPLRGFPWRTVVPWVDTPIAIVRWTAWRQGQQGYLKLTWRPRVGQWVEMQGPAHERDALLAFIELVRGRLKIGRPRGAGVAFKNEVEYLEALARFTEQAEKKNWDLRNAAVWTADFIADRLEPRSISKSQFYEENKRAEVNTDDIRNSRITWIYVESRRARL